MLLKQAIHVAFTDSTIVNTKQLRNVLISTFLISIILSLTQLYADSVVNTDGILYLQVASFIQKGDWITAGKLYNWLTYPYIIATLSSLTSLSLEYSAYFINTLFTAVTCTTFVLIVSQLGGNKKNTLLLATIIILCFPTINEYRTMVIRDHGYWSFYLLSCFFFFKSCLKPSFLTLFLFVFSIILATLFRAEGATFLILIPFMVYSLHLRKIKASKYPIVLYVFYALLIAIVIALWSFDIQTNGFTKLSSLLVRFTNRLALFFSTDSVSLQYTKNFLNALTSRDHSEDYAPTILFLTFLIILFTEVISSVGPLYAIGLLFSAYKKQFFPATRLVKPWLLLIIINMIILAGFTISRFFLAGRYPVGLALILILPLPFIINFIFNRYLTPPSKIKKLWPMYLLCILFASLSIDGLTSFGAKKDYLKEAGNWLANTNNSSSSNLYSNSPEVIFYSNTYSNTRAVNTPMESVIKQIKKGKLKNYDIIAIKVNRKVPKDRINRLYKLLRLVPNKVFSNKRGDRVLIFNQNKPY